MTALEMVMQALAKPGHWIREAKDDPHGWPVYPSVTFRDSSLMYPQQWVVDGGYVGVWTFKEHEIDKLVERIEWVKRERA